MDIELLEKKEKELKALNNFLENSSPPFVYSVWCGSILYVIILSIDAFYDAGIDGFILAGIYIVLCAGFYIYYSKTLDTHEERINKVLLNNYQAIDKHGYECLLNAFVELGVIDIDKTLEWIQEEMSVINIEKKKLKHKGYIDAAKKLTRGKYD